MSEKFILPTCDCKHHDKQVCDICQVWRPEVDRLTAEVERLKELVCSTTLQRNEYFVRVEQAEKERNRLHKICTKRGIELTNIEQEVIRYREALERIARMDDGVYSKGAFCSKIAREALEGK